MKKITLIRVIVLLIALTLQCLANRAWAVSENDYYVEKWTYDATVHENNVWDVCENITVNFVRPHHGIYIYRPTVFYDNHKVNGKTRKMKYVLDIDKISILDFKYQILDGSDEQCCMIFKIGDQDRELQGFVTYSIKYRITYTNDRATDCDRLFHSVIGDGWESAIHEFSFNINFDKPLPDTSLRSLTAFSGSWGGKSDVLDVTSKLKANNHNINATIKNIPSKCAITLNANLPEGYYVGAKSISPNYFWMLYALTLILGLIIIIKLTLHGKQNATPTVEFYPPKGISSAEVGTIIDESADIEDLASLIPWWAGKGYITITEIPDSKGRYGKNADLELRKIQGLPPNAPAYQHHFWNVFFNDTSVIRLKNLGDKHSQIASATSALKSMFKGDKKLSFLNNNYLLYIPFILLYMFTYATSSEVTSFETGCIVAGIMIACFSSLAFCIRLASGAKRLFDGNRGTISLILIAFVILLTYGITHMINDDSDVLISNDLAVILIILNAAILYLSRRFYVDTDYRIEITGKLIGLREFIDTAEQDRLKALLTENPEYFYDILPYAIVFGLSKKWSKQFKDLDMKQPDWYHGDPMANNLAAPQLLGAQVANNLVSQINKNIIDTVKASSHDPSSGSSGGGGGFSGGGGGGGGGGAW